MMKAIFSLNDFWVAQEKIVQGFKLSRTCNITLMHVIVQVLPTDYNQGTASDS